jgi:hypothetical protein
MEIRGQKSLDHAGSISTAERPILGRTACCQSRISAGAEDRSPKQTASGRATRLQNRLRTGGSAGLSATGIETTGHGFAAPNEICSTPIVLGLADLVRDNGRSEKAAEEERDRLQLSHLKILSWLKNDKLHQWRIVQSKWD